MKVTITIGVDNAAFGAGCTGLDIESILNHVRRDLVGVGTRGELLDWHGRSLMDCNGNTVGRVTVTR